MSRKEIGPLGRGLSAMLSEASGSSSINDIDITHIFANPDQPRRSFSDEALQELAQSIKALGIVQPITLKKESDTRYLIISGERRWRASKLAGLTRIPAYIRTADDEEIMEMALIENVQREDLNAIEISLALQRLLDSGMDRETISDRIGKNRTTISNYLRLLNLPAEVQLGVTEKKIEMGHARAILALSEPEDQLALYARCVGEALSVRQVERCAKEMMQAGAPATQKCRKQKHEKRKGEYEQLARHLSDYFGQKVRLECNARGKGTLAISFDSEEQLAHIIQLLESNQRL